MKTVAVIQARMGSSRLPGKVLADVVGIPMLGRVIARVRLARAVDEVVVATSVSPADDAVEQLCSHFDIRSIRGSEQDVLDRFHTAAQATDAEVVVRLTADCPLLDPAVIDAVVETYLAGGYDYVSNVAPPTFPDGLDTEVFSRAALERAWRDADLRSEREHVTPYLREHPELFRRGAVLAGEDCSHLRWTVDTFRDLEFVREVYARMQGGVFGWRDVLELVRAHPELMTVNAGTRRNEGYETSLRQDTRVDLPENS